ncbi:MAG: VCBS repeat-containing protein [Bacteroidales bacterium]|nr:VCBS repeat-containing protein [Bacteroidales bacterium]
MKFYTSLIVLFICTYVAVGQPFVLVPAELPAIGRSAVAFADFDNDHDLDLVMTGLDDASNAFGKIFLNQQGEFVETEAGIIGLYNSALAVADYDHDGNIDFVVTGEDQQGNVTRLYRNNGDATFVLVEAGFYAAGADGDLAWGDYDNDSWPDLVISGGWDTKLYHNNGDGTFQEANAGLTIMNSPSVDWGDCDNDGDLDLLMVGDAGSVAETFVYVNDHGNFSRLESDMEGTVGGTAVWGDYDNDGYLDILMTGKDISLNPVSYVYRNNGENTFLFGDAGLVGTALGPSDWIDYDNDGDLDIMLAGENCGCGNASTLLYNNNGVGGFEQVLAGLPFIERASSAWGDFDNDGDSDLLLTGLAGDPATFFYRNDLQSGEFQQNTVPGVPGDLYTYVDGEYAVISWGRATDIESPQMAISYNVMLGSQSGGIDIVSPQASTFTGERYSVVPGNAGTNDFMVFRNLEPGNYYFRIQAIDQSYEGSEFSEEGSFTVLSTGVNHAETPEARIFTVGTLLNVINQGVGDTDLTVISLTGNVVWSGTIAGNEFILPLDNYPSGVYLIRMVTNGKQVIAKVIR